MYTVLKLEGILTWKTLLVETGDEQEQGVRQRLSARHVC